MFNRDSKLLDAATKGELETVRTLLNNKADVNVKATSFPYNAGSTPLMQAAKGGYLEIVSNLLDSKANVNHQDEKGYTALIFAASISDNSKMVRKLLDHKADIHRRDKKGNTAIILAARNNSCDSINVLLDYKANIYDKNKNGDDALSIIDGKNENRVNPFLMAPKQDRDQVRELIEYVKIKNEVESTFGVKNEKKSYLENIMKSTFQFFSKKPNPSETELYIPKPLVGIVTSYLNPIIPDPIQKVAGEDELDKDQIESAGTPLLAKKL